MRRRYYITSNEQLVRELQDELYRARHDIVDLMPTDVAQLLLSFYSCQSRRDFHAWKGEAIEKIVKMATPDPEASYFQERGYCPLCKGGSLGPYDRGFTLPEGLRRHLEGFGNTHICPVTNAAFNMAIDALWEKFEAAEKVEQDSIEQRRKTDRVYLTELESPPKFLDEGLWFGKPRSAEQLVAAEQRLRDLGFEIVTKQNVVSYEHRRDAFLVLADPRQLGRINFRVYIEQKMKRGGRVRSDSFYLLDSWKNDIGGKFESRLTEMIQSLAKPA